MFAVPGWNVSAHSLAPEKPGGLTSSPRPLSDSRSRKRKRSANDAESSRKIGGLELEKLWDDRFGDKKEKKPVSHLNRTKVGDHTASNRKTEAQTDGSTHDTTDRRPLGRNDGRPQSTAQSTKQNKSQKQKRDHKDQNSQPNALETNSSQRPAQPPHGAPSTLTPLQMKMRNKLTSARFRHLNQTLYTTPSTTALSLFTANPSLFSEYHAGFTQQVQSSWPTNPVDIFISRVLSRAPLTSTQPQHQPPLPRRKTSSCTIADLGAGDGPLARQLHAHPKFKHLQLKIHSYDLHSPNKHVTVADIASLPLRDGEADIAIFCLSLMGTNWIDFVEEAWRILRGDGKGELWVAEVKSRFGRRKGNGVVDHSVGKQRKMPKNSNSSKHEPDDDEDAGEELFASSTSISNTQDPTDISPFTSVLQRRGFALQPSTVDTSNKMFVSMTFVKSGAPTAGKYKGWKWNGKEYATQHDGRGKTKRFVGNEDDEEINPEEEAKVLKPCVYKSR